MKTRLCAMLNPCLELEHLKTLVTKPSCKRVVRNFIAG